MKHVNTKSRMKFRFVWGIKLLICLFLIIMGSNNSFSQANASINILSLNSGQVYLQDTGYIQVDIGNTGPNDIGVNKVRAQISIPSIATAVASALQTGLPSGWIITNNNGAAITICNGSDVIPSFQSRTILIKVLATTLGGPSTTTGVLSFGPGTGVCTGPGSLPGDLTADNTSTTTLQVLTNPAPVVLNEFTAVSKNCISILKWIAESEINTKKYIIERRVRSNDEWINVGEVNASGNGINLQYSFNDKESVPTGYILYRLKMVDIDGTFKYSSVKLVYNNCSDAGVNIFPNPAKNQFFLNATDVRKTYKLTIIGLNGNICSEYNNLKNQSRVDISKLTRGLYLLQFKDESGVKTISKLIVNN